MNFPAGATCAHGTARTAAPGAALVLSGLLLGAFALRVAVFAATRNTIHPDEIYQVLEPAHRLAFGGGLLTWEYYIGVRSWLYPGVLAGFFAVGGLLGDNPAIQMLPVRSFVLAQSLIPVWCAWAWGRRLDGTTGGLVAGGIVALAPELVYLAPHTLSEIAAGNWLMAGLYAAFPVTTIPSRRRLAVAGALFALTFALRMHLAPALGLAACLACGIERRRWQALALGGGMVLLLVGALDWLTLGTPFQSIWLNYWVNIVDRVALEFGVEPSSVLILRLILLWGPVLVLIAIQAIVAGRRFPALVAVPLAVIATHLLIAHKEFRFIFPAFPPIATLCALAAVMELRFFRRHLRHLFHAESSLATMILGIWASIALLLGQSPFYQVLWTTARDTNDAFAAAARVPGLCGVGLVDALWLDMPGSAALPAHTPIYQSTRASLASESDAYNVAVVAEKPLDLGDPSERGPAETALTHALDPVLTYRAEAAVPPAPGAAVIWRSVELSPRFEKGPCFDGQTNAEGYVKRRLCLWVRAGGCRPGVPPPINWPAFFTDGSGTHGSGHGDRALIDSYRRGRHAAGADDLDARL